MQIVKRNYSLLMGAEDAERFIAEGAENRRGSTRIVRRVAPTLHFLPAGRAPPQQLSRTRQEGPLNFAGKDTGENGT